MVANEGQQLVLAVPTLRTASTDNGNKAGLVTRSPRAHRAEGGVQGWRVRRAWRVVLRSSEVRRRKA